MKNLHLIRYYARRYEPKQFENGGVRGWWIRVLNQLRYVIERRVVYHASVFLAQMENPLEDRSPFVREQEPEPDQPRRQKIVVRGRKFTPVSATGSVEAHLKEMRKPGRVESIRETTARVLDRYAADSRTKRYAFGRGERIMMEADTNEESENGKDTIEQPAESRGSSEGGSTPFKSGRARPIHPEYSATNLGSISGSEGDGGEDADEPESEIERERTASPKRNYRVVATAATQHQRSVLSREQRPPVAHGGDKSDQRADGAGAGAPRPLTEQPQQQGGPAEGAGEIGDEGTEARPESVVSPS